MTSLTSITSRMALAASSGVAPRGTSPVTTVTSASMSMPQASLATMGARGAMKPSLPPWYISGSV